MKPSCFLILAWVAMAQVWPAAGAAVIKEYDRVFTTYPYSDPDPVPAMPRYYPYFRYDGFTDTPVQKNWHVVELSNGYLQLLILPEIGGKVWAAIDKTTGKSFVYFNHAVKFRDVSMRGPWTSGGMEANYGIIGHTPNCFAPVDYLVCTNGDASVSCLIGGLDLLTRSTWRMEIRLPSNEAVFSTRSLWHNGSGADQPYYTWMNIGIQAGGNLECINPGNAYIGHDGRPQNWPKREGDGRDISWYENNDFGGAKSYHVLGHFSEFFGAFWHDQHFGMVHWSPFADKPGRKVWIWGLSRDGMIWEDLLTDTDGQYVEVQSGRLFNQSDMSSGTTPFKHREFAPYATDSWIEQWFPVADIGGFVTASPWGAMNVKTGSNLVVRVSPTREWSDAIEVFDGTNRLFRSNVDFKPLRLTEVSFPLTAKPAHLRVALGGHKLEYREQSEEVLDRPMNPPANFDWKSAYGCYVKGKEFARDRQYSEAESNFLQSLEVDTNFVPALAEMAGIANRRGEYVTAAGFARRALSVDTYDSKANYQYGLACAELGRSADAKAAFGLAALSTEMRSAAFDELAKQWMREQNYDRALEDAKASLEANSRNLDALQLTICAARLKGDISSSETAIAALIELDPLNHFARFERDLRNGTTNFTQFIRNELPYETCLELAAWYHGIGLDDESAKVLERALDRGAFNRYPVASLHRKETASNPLTSERFNAPEILYWLAYLHRDTNRLAQAEAAPLDFVFPFRVESIPVFKWAMERTHGWRAKYCLAMIRWHLRQTAAARELLASCGDEPAFAPFYAARAQVNDATCEADLRRAAQLDPGQWRYGKMLAGEYLRRTNAAAALSVASDYAKRFPGISALVMLHARALVQNHGYTAASLLMENLHLLPAEGTTDAHSLFREINLMLAVDQMKAGHCDKALELIAKAREWPERLGTGKPYPSDLDERLEDWLSYQCFRRLNSPEKAQAALDNVLKFPALEHRNSGRIVSALALKERNRTDDAHRLMQAWLDKDPENKLAKWGNNFIAGESNAALAEATTDTVCRVLHEFK